MLLNHNIQLEDVAVTHSFGLSGDFIHLQVVVQDRKIARVLNRRIRVTESPDEVINACDEDVVTSLIHKKASLIALKQNAEKARLYINGKVVMCIRI